MPAEVETMFSASREVPWHGLGLVIDEAVNSEEALKLAGLDWTVSKQPIYAAAADDKFIEIPGYCRTVRDTDNTTLGVVSPRYAVIQNKEAFAFTDNLIGDDVKYETAGSLRNGKTVWMLAKLPEVKILDDDVVPFICFTNSHDGFGAVKVISTPVRVVCNNTLSLALSSAKRSYSIRHLGDIQSKVDEARQVLELNQQYLSELNDTADKLANTTLNQEALEQTIFSLFPISKEATARTARNVEETRMNFYNCYMADDIKKFRGTAWGLVNAASDFATHAPLHRTTQRSAEVRWENVMNGNVIIDTTMLQMMRLAKLSEVA